MTANYYNTLMQLRALIVDDEGPIRRFLEELCEASGFVVDSVADGEPASVLLSSLLGRYDVVFLDIRMPNWNGYDTLAMLEGKDNRRYIVVTSGYADPEIINYAEKHPNVLKLLSKPFGTGVISEILRDVTLARHAKHDPRD